MFLHGIQIVLKINIKRQIFTLIFLFLTFFIEIVRAVTNESLILNVTSMSNTTHSSKDVSPLVSYNVTSPIYTSAAMEFWEYVIF